MVGPDYPSRRHHYIPRYTLSKRNIIRGSGVSGI